MRILHFLPDFQPKGPFIVAKNIAETTRLLGVDNLFLSMRGKGTDLSMLNNFLSLELNSTKLPSINTFLKLKEIIESERIDIIHAHGFWPTMLVSFLRINKLKTVTTIHNNPYEDYTMAYGRVLGWVMAYSLVSRLSKIGAVVAISEFVKSSIRCHNSKVVYNGVNIPHGCDSQIKNNLVFKEKKNINFGVVSALIERKNLKLAIDIINTLNNNGIDAVLSIVGEGPLENKLKEYANIKEVGHLVNFIGSLPYSSTIDFIDSLDFFILTSKSEGFGLVLVEAMMVETIPFAYNISATEEVIKNDDLLFSSVEEFAIKFDKVFSHSNEYKKYCLERYSGFFTSEVMGNNYLDVYSECLEVKD